MRSIVAASAVLTAALTAAAALAPVPLVGAASAQEAATYDSGGVQFSFPGWLTVESVTRPGEEHRRLITVQPTRNSNSARRCVLSARENEAAKGRTQAELNAGLQEVAPNMPTESGVETLKREVIVIDGVAVYEEEVFVPDGRFPLRSRTRHFSVAGDGQTMSYVFFCAAVNEATAGHAHDMDAVMDSLHFTEPTP